MEKIKVIAVVVTHNRSDLLKSALKSIEKQSYFVDKIVVVDNASSDGTFTLLDNLSGKNTRYVYIRLEQNTGGAGGFHIGLTKAYELGADFIWLIDDDAAADTYALQHLMKHAVEMNISFLCSNIFGNDGLPMNLPEVDFRDCGNGYPVWADQLSSGLVRVRTSTFVSILVKRNAIEAVGLPIKEMFIWGDDGEYTYRLSNFCKSYMVGKSIVMHRRKQKGKLHIFKENKTERIANYFYYYRNNVYISRKYKSIIQLGMFICRAFVDSLKGCLNGNIPCSKIILRGIFHGLFFNPKILHVAAPK